MKNLFDLSGKTALITGGGGLLGPKHAEAIVEYGGKVILADWHEDKAKEKAEKIGENATYEYMDVTDRESIESVVEKYDKIDILINNAANDDRHSTDQVDEKYWNNRMDVNLKHFFFTIKSVLGGMIKNNKGSIVNLSSVSWMLGEGDKVAYETAKSAVIGLTRSFAREFGKYNIRCNSVTPGSIATERQIKHWLTPKYKKLILDKQCLKRQLKPQEVANLILFLSSDASSGCTKQNFIVDAGIT